MERKKEHGATIPARTYGFISSMVNSSRRWNLYYLLKSSRKFLFSSSSVFVRKLALFRYAFVLVPAIKSQSDRSSSQRCIPPKEKPLVSPVCWENWTPGVSRVTDSITGLLRVSSIHRDEKEWRKKKVVVGRDEGKVSRVSGSGCSNGTVWWKSLCPFLISRYRKREKEKKEL